MVRALATKPAFPKVSGKTSAAFLAANPLIDPRSNTAEGNAPPLQDTHESAGISKFVPPQLLLARAGRQFENFDHPGSCTVA